MYLRDDTKIKRVVECLESIPVGGFEHMVGPKEAFRVFRTGEDRFEVRMKGRAVFRITSNRRTMARWLRTELVTFAPQRRVF